MELDKELRDMATELQDSQLLSKIPGSDIVALESKYHINCLVSYKNRYRSFKRANACSSQSGNAEESVIQARTFVELLSHIEGNVENGTYFFKLTELHSLFENRLH